MFKKLSANYGIFVIIREIAILFASGYMAALKYIHVH